MRDLHLVNSHCLLIFLNNERIVIYLGDVLYLWVSVFFRAFSSFFTHMLLFSFRSFFKMNIKDLLPSEGITDDVGANASSFEGYNNRLAEKCGIDCNDAPEGWTNKLKHFVANRKDLYLSKIQKPKKINS